MSKEHQLFKVSQKILLYKPLDKKFLIVKDAYPETEVCKKYGVWELPGGRVDEGELPEEVLERELVEELGDDIAYQMKGTVSRFFFSLVDAERVGIVYLGLYERGEIELSDEHAEYAWWTAEEIEKLPKEQEWLKRVVRDATQYLHNESYLTDLKRLQADFENYKKRVKNEEKELYGHLSAQIVTDLIPVLDNFHAATEHVPEEAKESPWVMGITYIERQFEEVLKNYGVEPLDVKPGDPFDPKKHEALDHKTVEDKPDAPLKIEKIVQKGYQIKDKIIRPAKVIVTS